MQRLGQFQATSYDILLQAKFGSQMLISTQYEALQDQIDSAVEILRDGGVIAIPTDTLYGLASCAFDEDAVDRIFRLKGRAEAMALPLLLADAEDVSKCAQNVPDIFWKLSGKFWPGALTIVLKKAEVVPDVVSAGMDTVALRIPDHWVPRAIVRGLGAPITGTSANRSGSPSLVTAEAVRQEFGDELDLIVDAGEISGGMASTVLDLSGERSRILREGAVSSEDLDEIIRSAIGSSDLLSEG